MEFELRNLIKSVTSMVQVQTHKKLLNLVQDRVSPGPGPGPKNFNQPGPGRVQVQKKFNQSGPGRVRVQKFLDPTISNYRFFRITKLTCSETVKSFVSRVANLSNII